MLLYTPNQHAAGTHDDLAALAAAAIDAWVFRMRRAAQRLPAHEVEAPTHGHVVPVDRYGEPDRFYVRLHQPGQFADWVMELHSARLVRAAGGCYQFTGEKFDWGRQQHHRQTWLCTPTPERGYDIRHRMADAGRRRSDL